MNRKKTVAIIAVLVVVAAGTYSVPVYLAQPTCPSWAPMRSFSIVAIDPLGYNNSRYQPLTINVQKGDCVLIKFVNESSPASHGLAIRTYVPKVIVAHPGETKTTEFYARETGQFQIFEDLFSPTFYFNHGVLNVT